MIQTGDKRRMSSDQKSGRQLFIFSSFVPLGGSQLAAFLGTLSAYPRALYAVGHVRVLLAFLGASVADHGALDCHQVGELAIP